MPRRGTHRELGRRDKGHHSGPELEPGGGATGLLVPPRDAFALAEAMIRAMELDDGTLERLRRNGKKRGREDFTWENACRRYVRVYEGTVDKAVPPFLR